MWFQYGVCLKQNGSLYMTPQASFEQFGVHWAVCIEGARFRLRSLKTLIETAVTALIA